MMAALRNGGCLALLLAGVVSIGPTEAQVSVAPTALFLSEQEPFGGIYVSNASDTPQEVTLEFRFGYPAADSLGNVAMLYEDNANAARYSIAPYVRAFPQRFVLPPGETQVVRLTASIPGEAGEGLYWTRVLTTSTPQGEFEAAPDVDGIQTRLQFRLQQVTGLFYRRGTPQIAIGLGEIVASVDATEAYLLADIEHTGNSPFFGSAGIRVLDGNRRVVHEETQAVAVYVTERRRFNLRLPERTPGTYTVEIQLSAERTDLPQEQLSRLDPVTGQAELIIPAGF